MAQRISDAEMKMIIQNDIHSLNMRASNVRRFDMAMSRYYEGQAAYARKVLREMLGEDENMEDFNNL